MRRFRLRGFSLPELLIAMTLSVLMTVVIVALYQSGLWEFHHSSGRIELARKGRVAIDRIQPLISTAVKFSAEDAILYPELPVGGVDIFDDTQNPGDSRIIFSTPVDLLGNAPLPTARQLAANPVYHLFEIAAVPNADDDALELVLRKRQWDDTASPPIGAIDAAATPKVLARDLYRFGDTADPNDPTGFNIKRLRAGAVQVRVRLVGDQITDDIVRARTEARTPIDLVMSTVVHVPYYSKQ